MTIRQRRLARGVAPERLATKRWRPKALAPALRVPKPTSTRSSDSRPREGGLA